MRIKLPFTEKFLWDLYKFLDATESVLSLFVQDRPYHFKGLDLFSRSGIKIFKSNWEIKNKRNKKDMAMLIYNLRQNGYLKTLKVKDKSAVILTQKGLEKVFMVKMKLKDKKTRQDKQWQMVLFDIPEKKRKERDYFRRGLQCLGYKKLQKSIWVCPYNIEKETQDLIKRYKLGSYVELLLVKKIGLG
jgi:hypothetical protein